MFPEYIYCPGFHWNIFPEYIYCPGSFGEEREVDSTRGAEEERVGRNESFDGKLRKFNFY